MSTTCQTFITPVYEEDECGGKRTNVTCVYDTNIYAELGLETNSTQEEFNQAIYIAFINLKAQVTALQEIIDGL